MQDYKGPGKLFRLVQYNRTCLRERMVKWKIQLRKKEEQEEEQDKEKEDDDEKEEEEVSKAMRLARET